MSTDTNFTAPAYAPPSPPAGGQSRRVRNVVFITAGVLLAGAGGFLAGRSTAPETASTSAAGTTSIVTATVSADQSAPTTATDPNGALLEQALALHQAGKVTEASALYEQILKADPKNKYALFNLGQIAQTNQQYPAAIEKYNAALAVDPNFTSALYNGGLAYASNGDRTNAISLLRRLIELEPDNAPGLYNLGTVLIADGKTEEGTGFLNKAYELNPALKPQG